MAEIKGYACPECGCDLSYDIKQNRYMCKQCSSDRGYALYLGSPLLMGMEGIKDGKFSEADQRFAHILMFDQVNIDAHRGRILCAGKWKSFQGIELSDNLSEVDWQLVQLRVDESIKRSTDRSRYYYDLIKETISLLKQYSDVLVMLQIDPDNTKYQQEKETLSREYPPMLRKLMYIDRVHHSISWNHTKNVFDLDRLANAPVALKQGDLVEAEDCYRVLNLDHPKDPVILHNWVLCGGKWSSFSEMKITDYSTQYYISILIGRLIEARQFSPENYHSFYDSLFELIKLMIGYYENELESKAEEYETVKMRLQEKFDRCLSDFIKTDSELFGGTVSS